MNAFSKRDIVLLTGLSLTALAIRFYFLQFFRVINADGVGYAQIARAIIRGEGFSGATHFPPFFSILIGLMNLLVPDVELAGRLVSTIMGSLIVIPIYLLAVEFFNKRTGLMACLLTIAWPSMRSLSGEVMSQTTYITLILTGIYLFWKASKKDSIITSLASGLFMALAYLTRPEGFIVFFVLSVALMTYAFLAKLPMKRQIVLISVAWAAFFIVSFPYLNLLHSKTGSWQLTGKTGAAIADSMGEYLGKVDQKREPGFQPLGFLDVVRKYPDFIRWNLERNLTRTWNEMAPTYIWFFSIVGLIAGGWAKGKIGERLFLLSTFSPLILTIVLFFVGPEYFLPYLPVLFLWACNGFLKTEKFIAGLPWMARVKLLAKISQESAISLFIVFIIAITMLWQQIPGDLEPYHFSQDGARYDHKKIGLLLAKYLPSDTKIMTRQGRIGFYSDRKWTDLPHASLPEIINIAKKEKARFIVVDGMLQGQRPQLGLLWSPLFPIGGTVLRIEQGEVNKPIPGLRLYLLFKDPSSLGVAVYEIIN